MIIPAYWVPRISRLKPTILPQKPSSRSVKSLFQPGMRSLTGLAETIMPMMTAKSMGRMGMMAMPSLISCFPMRGLGHEDQQGGRQGTDYYRFDGLVGCIVCSLVIRCPFMGVFGRAMMGA